MPNLTLTEAFSDIADAIRDKNGTQNTYTPAQMPAAIEDLDTDPPVLQTKTINPNETLQIVTPDSGYDALSRVDVTAINSNYIGSGVTRRDSTDLTASGASVTVPAGYYAEAASKSVSTATQATPSVTINTSTGVVTGSATQTAGYVSAGTKSGTLNLDTVNGTTIMPTESEQTAVAANKYTLGEVKIGAISSSYIGSGIAQRDDTDLTASGATVTVPAGYYAEQETKSVSTTSHPDPTVSVNSTTGLITASHTQTAGYVSAGTTTETSQLSTQMAVTITPSTSEQTAVAAGKYTTGVVKVAAMPSGALSNPSILVNSTTGLITATSGVGTAGYLATSATASNTSQLSTQAGTTITPTKSSQVAVAAGKYTIGAVNVAAIPANYIDTTDATAAATDIVSGETAYVNGSKLTGSLVINKYYTGSSIPSSSLGNDGDIYFQS